MKKTDNIIICLVGCSGSGKTTVAEQFEADGYKAVQSYTTRAPRFANEKGHTFVSSDEFDALKDILAYNEYNGNRYCTTQEQIDDSDIYVVDIPGVKMLKEKYHGTKKIFVVGLTCSPKTVAARMRLRGDSEKAIKSRLKEDAIAFADLNEHCDFIFNNENATPIAIKKVIENVIETFKEETPKKALKNLKIGDTVYLGNEFIITNIDSTTCALVAKHPVKEMNFGENFRWKDSHIRKFLNDQYLYLLLQYVHYDDLLGLETQSVWDKVSILNPEEYKAYKKLFPDSTGKERFWLADTVNCKVFASGNKPGEVTEAVLYDITKLTFGVRPIIIVNNTVEVNIVSEC